MLSLPQKDSVAGDQVYAKFHPWLFVPLVTFLILHVARPFLVGFYHDDWSIFVEPHTFSPQQLWDYSVKYYAERPIECLVYYSIARFWDGRPETLTLIASAFVALSALCLYIFLSRIVRLATSHQTSIPAFATAAWIAIPWGMGYSLWATGAATLTALIFFLMSSVFFIDYMTRGKSWRLALALLTLALSYLDYQAYYLGFASVILLITALHAPSRPFYLRAVSAMAGGMIIQILAVLLVRTTTKKSISFSLSLIFKNFFSYLPRSMHAGLQSLWYAAILLFCFLCVMAILQMQKWDAAPRKRFVLAIAACLLGIFIGTLPYSMAQYGLQGIGLFSRTTVGTNIWMAVLLTVMALPLTGFSKSTRQMHVVFLVLLLILTGSSLWLTQPWIQSWARQKEIMAVMPYEAIRHMSVDDVLILNEPVDIRGVAVFGAPWDISSAVFSKPEMRNLFAFDVRPQLTPFYTDVPMSWDPANGIFTLRPGWTTPAKRVWVFTPSTKELIPITEAGTVHMPSL